MSEKEETKGETKVSWQTPPGPNGDPEILRALLWETGLQPPAPSSLKPRSPAPRPLLIQTQESSLIYPPI